MCLQKYNLLELSSIQDNLSHSIIYIIFISKFELKLKYFSYTFTFTSTYIRGQGGLDTTQIFPKHEVPIPTQIILHKINSTLFFNTQQFGDSVSHAFRSVRKNNVPFISCRIICVGTSCVVSNPLRTLIN